MTENLLDFDITCLSDAYLNGNTDRFSWIRNMHNLCDLVTKESVDSAHHRMLKTHTIHTPF